MNEKVRVLILGSGPAGYTAAIYAARANLNPVLYEGLEPGGQLTTTTEVENYPGYPDGVTGPAMMEDFKKQAIKYGAKVLPGRATAVDFSTRPLKVTIDNEKVIETDTVIISTGATAKYLGLEDETKYAGQGVSACATCDGFFYRKKKVAVVGGGDTACEEATYLSGLADKVYMIVRKPYLRASQIMQDRVMNNPKIEILFEHNAVGLFGDNGVEGVHLVKRMGEADEEKVDIAVDGFSWPLVTNLIQRFSKIISNSIMLGTLKLSIHTQEQMLKEYLLVVMWQILYIVRQLLQQERVAVQLWMQNVI